MATRDRSSARRAGARALDVLGAEERATVLELLLSSSPRLAADAERIARDLLEEASAEAVAEEVEWELRSLSADELGGRAGRRRFGYVDPTEAAWEILGEAIEPHSEQVKRLVDLGMTDAATAMALGTVAGLYRCRTCEDGELLLSWAPGFAADHAEAVLEDLVEAGADVPAERLAELVPEWTERLADLRCRR